MSRLLIMGALHHDVVVDAPRLPRLDETLVGSGIDYRFGGKGGNQALAAARMGASVSMAGRVGDDDAGRGMRAVLDAAGIGHSAVITGHGPSGMSVAITDAAGNYGAVIVSGANLENDGQVACDPAPQIVLIQNEVPEAANVALAQSLPTTTNLIWNAAPARPWNEALAAHCDLLIVNRLEATDLTGETDPEIAAKTLHSKIKGSVIVTLGGAGALYTTPTAFIGPKICRGARGAEPLASGDAEGGAIPAVEVQHVSAETVQVVSTHGAGDMFTGALVARLLAADDLGAAIGFAQKAAGLFVATPISERSAVDLARVEAYS